MINKSNVCTTFFNLSSIQDSRFAMIFSIHLLMLFSMISNNKSEGFSRNKGLFPFDSLQQRDSCAHCLFCDEESREYVLHANTIL